MMAAVQPFLSGAISKCVTGDTLVTTADGLLRIGGLYEGEEPGSFRRRSGKWPRSGQEQDGRLLLRGPAAGSDGVLRSGMKVTGTPNHRLLTAGPGGLLWRRLDEIPGRIRSGSLRR